MYRMFIRLYPRPFRDAYGFDLEQHFDDLVRERGILAAWVRTALDLAVTVPRYRLETVMNDRQSGVALGMAAFALCVAGVASTFVDFYAGAPLLVVGVAVALTQRSAIASALRPPNVGSRRRRLRTAAILTAVCVASFIAYLILIGDHWTVRETVLTVIGNTAMIGAVGFLIAGLLTPRPTT